MRKTLLVAAFVPVLALAAEYATYKFHNVDATVISTNPRTNTLTLKGDAGVNRHMQVEGAAVAKLGAVKPGDKVTITCKDTPSGEHLLVTDIKINK